MNKAPAAARTIELQRADAAWAEGTLTWNTQPGATGATVTVTTGTTRNVRHTWTVTEDVAGFVAGSIANTGWRLKDQPENTATNYDSQFRSTEHVTASERPQLIIFYATP